MFLEQIAAILKEEGIATLQEDLFIFSAPATLQTYTLLMYGGEGIPVDNELPGYYNTRYQVIVRHYSYDDGFALANDIKEALTFYGKVQDNITFKYSLPREEPRPWRRNEAGIVEFSINFLVSFVKE